MNTPQNIYDDDPSHAIPLLETIDLIGLRKNNGIDLVIVVSKKLESDERSQRRLLKKIEIYLDYIESSDYYNEYGLPSVEATRILLRLTHGCDPEIHELVKRCEAWTKENRAQLVTTYGE